MENKNCIKQGDMLIMDGFLDFSKVPSYLVLQRKNNTVIIEHFGNTFKKRILIDYKGEEYIKMSKRTWLSK